MKSRLVAGPVVVADEVRVDVEAGVGDDAEVLVLFAVEVERFFTVLGRNRWFLPLIFFAAGLNKKI